MSKLRLLVVVENGTVTGIFTEHSRSDIEVVVMDYDIEAWEDLDDDNPRKWKKGDRNALLSPHEVHKATDIDLNDIFEHFNHFYKTSGKK